MSNDPWTGNFNGALWYAARKDIWLPDLEPYLGKLSKRAQNQLRAAFDIQRPIFLTQYVWPRLFNPVGGMGKQEPWYLCLSDTAFRPGRNHLLSETFWKNGSSEFLSSVGAAAYFTNPLLVGTVQVVDGQEDWSPPSERVYGGFWQAFTIEFDVDDPAFFEDQLAWCRGTDAKSKIGKLFAHFSQYVDFEGIVVNWSGNKSLHIHVVFDSWPVVEANKLDRTRMRQGLIAHWERVHADTRGILEVPSNIRADDALRLPDAFRRLPGGARKLDKPNILGMPAGTDVPQLILWEKFRQRADRGQTALFFQPHLFVAAPAAQSSNYRSKVGEITPEQHAYAFEQLARHFAGTHGYPKLARLEHDDRYGWRAYFLNSPHDRNPSSIMKEGHNRIYLQGKDRHELEQFNRPMMFPLGKMMELWLDKYTLVQRHVVEVDPFVKARDQVEQEFADAVKQPSDAEGAMETAITNEVTTQLLLLKGPEGVGKSRGYFKHHAMQTDGAKLSMYAFNTYEAAEAKCREFNDMQAATGSGHVGVFLESFDRVYKRICESRNVQPISNEDALRDRKVTRLDYIRTVQKNVFADLERQVTRIHNDMQGKPPHQVAFFTVHQVLENWQHNSPSRFWWQHGWLDGSATDVSVLRENSQLGFCVYDEIGWTKLVEIQPQEVLDWLDAFRAAYPGWANKAPSDKLADYDAWMALGAPTRGVQGEARPRRIEVGWDEFNRLMGNVDWVPVSVRRHEYERQLGTNMALDIYDVEGRRWGVHQRDWWQGVSDRLVVLTTEMLPTVLASEMGFRIVNLDVPHLDRDTVKVELSRRASTKNVQRAIADFHKRHGDDVVVISNSAKHIEGAITHARAKGSNKLIGRPIMQTMLHMSPEAYEQLEVLNTWAGRRDCVGLAHVDEFNQSAGRNLGFRKRGDAQHWLVLSAELWLKLMYPLAQYSRYNFELQLDKNAVYELRRKQDTGRSS